MSPTLPGATSAFGQCNGMQMHYVTMGPPEGAPVLLLHGFPEFWYSWRFQMPALAEQGYFVIAPDQRGYNLSDKHGPYDIETLVADIIALLDELGIESCQLVGHDWGGVLAWSLASYHPARFERLVVMNAPHPNAYLDALKSSFQLFKSWYIYLFQLPKIPEWLLRCKNWAALRKIYAQVPREFMHAKDVAHYVDAMKQPGALSAALGWYRAIPAQTRKHGGSLPDPIIQQPTLVIWGEKDLALGKACNRTLDRYVPELELHYLPDASHWVQMDHPNEVNAQLERFLSQHS